HWAETLAPQAVGRVQHLLAVDAPEAEDHDPRHDQHRATSPAAADAHRLRHTREDGHAAGQELRQYGEARSGRLPDGRVGRRNYSELVSQYPRSA
nr:hypothetical protein [Tanacetum cinerariifolium]